MVFQMILAVLQAIFALEQGPQVFLLEETGLLGETGFELGLLFREYVLKQFLHFHHWPPAEVRFLRPSRNFFSVVYKKQALNWLRAIARVCFLYPILQNCFKV